MMKKTAHSAHREQKGAENMLKTSSHTPSYCSQQASFRLRYEPHTHTHTVIQFNIDLSPGLHSMKHIRHICPALFLPQLFYSISFMEGFIIL